MAIMVPDKSVCVCVCEFKLISKRLWEPCSCQQATRERNTALEKQRGRGGGKKGRVWVKRKQYMMVNKDWREREN